MSLTLCQAVERRLVWRLYELSSHSSERSTSQLQTSLHNVVVFFISLFIYFHTRGDEMFPVRQKNCRVALQVFLSCMGPRILGRVPSRLALRGMAVLKQSLLFLPRSWIQLRVQQGLEAKGPGSCPGLKAKMSQGGPLQSKHVRVKRFTRVQLFPTPGTAAHQAPLSTGLSRQEYCSGLPCRPPGHLPSSGIKLASLTSPALQAESLLLNHWGSPHSDFLKHPT